MASTEGIYSGAGYWFDNTYGMGENYGESFLNIDYRFPASQIGTTTPVQQVNQLAAVSQKLSTGIKTIEVQGVSTQVLESIPKQQFKEINRLKKLVGVDLTFHGPIVEPTGIRKQGWQESDRRQSEYQMSSAVSRSHELDPKGNVVVTFHSSAIDLEPETIVINEKGEQEIKEFFVVDENTGNFQNMGSQLNYLKKQTKLDPNSLVEKQNEEIWFRELQGVNFHARQGSDQIKDAISSSVDAPEEMKKIEKEGGLLELYKLLGTEKGQKILKGYKGEIKELVEGKLNQITSGDIHLRDAYTSFQTLFNRAYKTAEMAADLNKNTDDLKKLNELRDRIYPKINQIEKDASKVPLLAQELTHGINVLRTISTPQTLKPLRPWAIDKSSTTFANVAFDAYKKFKNTAPIISIENPPVGTGLSRGEDLKEIVKKAREKFSKQAQEKLHMSESDARMQAEKLIGVTWDVGHINMLRGRGFKEKHLIEETKKIAPYVKHVHLSDNFGIEHTELPMGMGNVPTKKHLELIHKYNEQVKKITETGNWWEPFKTTPLKETLRALGSPLYGADNGPYWNQIADASAGYFVGQGAVNPQIHHSMFGTGFANLPIDLGGQMGGQSRVSGAPID